jgi:hypothetical protein
MTPAANFTASIVLTAANFADVNDAGGHTFFVTYIHGSDKGSEVATM